MKWIDLPLAQITKRFISGGTPNTKISEYWTGDIPWITGADILDGSVTIGRRYINVSALNNSATNIVPKGSLLMVTRTGVGKIALAPVDIAISQDFTGIILKEGIEPKYALEAIRSRMPSLLAVQRGATIKGVTRNDVANLKIPLPPISEQRRIVEILDQADRLRKLRADADAKAARILPALFYKMFGDPVTNPKGWPVKLLGNPQVATINPRFADTSVSDDMVFSFVPMADVEETWGRIIGRQVRPYSEVKRGFTAFRDDDVLFAKITPCMQNGKAAIAKNLINGCGFGSTEFHVLRAGTAATPEWLFALVRLSWFRKQAEANFTGTAGQQRVPSDFLQKYKIACPPIELQLKFANTVAQLLKRVDRADGSKQTIDRLFATLFYRSFTGDLTASWRQAHIKVLLQEMERQSSYLEKVK